MKKFIPYLLVFIAPLFSNEAKFSSPVDIKYEWFDDANTVELEIELQRDLQFTEKYLIGAKDECVGACITCIPMQKNAFVQEDGSKLEKVEIYVFLSIDKNSSLCANEKEIVYWKKSGWFTDSTSQTKTTKETTFSRIQVDLTKTPKFTLNSGNTKGILIFSKKN